MSKIVMPAAGKWVARPRTEDELQTVGSAALAALGESVLDIYLNEAACWRGIPEAAWQFKVGGFQVLRKWLSYRDKSVIGRPLSVAEARQFTSVARRLSALVLLGEALNINYRTATGAVSQEPLPTLAP